MSNSSRPGVECVFVEAPARLHMGFMDLNGTSGRCYGSVGLALDRPCTRVCATRAEGLSAQGPQSDRALDCLHLLQQAGALPGGVSLIVEKAIPAHIGLGSGTQLCLAVGSAVSQLYELGFSLKDLARLLDRGARSGIGVGAFEHGGFLVDGGRGKGDEPPPVVARLPFPEQWRVLLVLDRGACGLHGVAESEAFRRLPVFPAECAAHLCHLVLMKVLPALVEEDIQVFGEAIGEIQRTVGDHFAPAQGGRFASSQVTQALAWLEAQGVACVGQSSWGPTGFAVVDSETCARSLMRKAAARWDTLGFTISRGRNFGAEEWIQALGLEPGVRWA